MKRLPMLPIVLAVVALGPATAAAQGPGGAKPAQAPAEPAAIPVYAGVAPGSENATQVEAWESIGGSDSRIVRNVTRPTLTPFLPAAGYEATWQRIRAALSPGSRFSGMLFGDRDQAASEEPDMTCPAPEVIRGHLAGFRIEHWEEKEEDGHTALGEPHHFHLIEVVAVRTG